MLKTTGDVLEVANQIRAKQRGDKANAMAHLIEAYQILASHKKEGVKHYIIVDDIRCAKCGGIILEQVEPLGMLTPGGRRLMGCPNCNIFSYKFDKSKYVKLEESSKRR